MKSEPIILNLMLPYKKSQVWSALTKLEEMHQWYFSQIPAFKPEKGFKTEFLIENEGRQFTHQWEVLEVTHQESIKYNWTFAEYPGSGTTLFELSEAEGGTNLHFTDDILEPFPQDIPEFKRESGVAGWNWFLNEQLPKYMQNK